VACQDLASTKERTVVKLGTSGRQALVALSLAACSQEDAKIIFIGGGGPSFNSPTMYRPDCPQFCHDDDGDGRGRGVTISDGCEDATTEPPPGFAQCHQDCNDSDPNVYASAVQDHDGDGYGFSGEPARCVGELRDYGSWPRDCDDENPDVHPGVPEQWLDGINSDCTGAEDPDDCSAEEFDSAPVEIDSSCGNVADLFVVRTFGCYTHCAEQWYVVVGNRGGSALDERVVLTTLDEREQSTTISLTLEPGARSNPLTLPPAGYGPFDVTVELESNPPECDPDNNRGQGNVRIASCN
jgi:hypothetical protein